MRTLLRSNLYLEFEVLLPSFLKQVCVLLDTVEHFPLVTFWLRRLYSSLLLLFLFRKHSVLWGAVFRYAEKCLGSSCTTWHGDKKENVSMCFWLTGKWESNFQPCKQEIKCLSTSLLHYSSFTSYIISLQNHQIQIKWSYWFSFEEGAQFLGIYMMMEHPFRESWWHCLPELHMHLGNFKAAN